MPPRSTPHRGTGSGRETAQARHLDTGTRRRRAGTAREGEMGFFDTVRDKAGALATDAGRAGKVTAAQARLVVLQNDLRKAERELGHAAFALAERGELDHPDLAHAVERLRATAAEVSAKEAEIAALRDEPLAPAAASGEAPAPAATVAATTVQTAAGPVTVAAAERRSRRSLPRPRRRKPRRRRRPPLQRRQVLGRRPRRPSRKRRRSPRGAGPPSSRPYPSRRRRRRRRRRPRARRRPGRPHPGPAPRPRSRRGRGRDRGRPARTTPPAPDACTGPIAT